MATFEGQSFWGIKYQTLLIISQGLGYMASKFYGIKFISELKQTGTLENQCRADWGCLVVFAAFCHGAGALGNGMPVWQWFYAWLYVGDYFQLC